MRVKTFDTLWIENGVSASPPLKTAASTPMTVMPKKVGIDASEFRDVVRDRTAIGSPSHGVHDFVYDGLERWRVQASNRGVEGIGGETLRDLRQTSRSGRLNTALRPKFARELFRV